jgi:hypothetical protein
MLHRFRVRGWVRNDPPQKKNLFPERKRRAPDDLASEEVS